MADFEKLKKEMQDFFDSPAGQASIEKFRKSMELKDEKEEKLWEFLESLSQERFDELLSQFILWEDAFEEREYQKGKLKSSNIYNTLFDAIRKHGTEYENDDMFFGGGASYRGYEFLVYVGQGSFYTIEKKGERIFTST